MCYVISLILMYYRVFFWYWCWLIELIYLGGKDRFIRLKIFFVKYKIKYFKIVYELWKIWVMILLYFIKWYILILIIYSSFNNVILFKYRYMNDCYLGFVIFNLYVLKSLRVYFIKRYFINNIGCEINWCIFDCLFILDIM